MDRASIQDAEMEVSFLSYGMVAYSHAMGEGSTVFYVATRSVLGRSVEAKLSFMTLVAHLRQTTSYWLIQIPGIIGTSHAESAKVNVIK